MARQLHLDFSSAEAQRSKLTAAQEKYIRKLYKDAAKDIKKQAEKAPRVPSDALRKEYLNKLQGQINAALKQIEKDVDKSVRSSMTSVATATVKDAQSFAQGVGLSVQGSYSHVPMDIVQSVASGQLYEGNWSLSKALWLNTKDTQKDVQGIVAKGIIENKSAYDIAKDLEKYVDPSARKPWDWGKVYPGCRRVIDYNAQRLARTMVSHAYQQAFVRTTINNPFVTKYQWEASNSERICQLCMDRDGLYFSKDDLPLDHPNGMCTYVAVIEDDMNAIADRLAEWVNGAEDADLDNWAKDMYGDGWEGQIYRSEPLIPGKDDPELTDSIWDYYLPQQTREHLSEIEALQSYRDFVDYFKKHGVSLDTDLEALKTTRRDDSIPAVRELCQKLATATDAYRVMFGEQALSKLERIILYDSTLDTQAAYHFNRIGENDPFAGTIRFSNWNADGRTVFHELAHAFQDSQAKTGEDAVTFAERMVTQANLNPKFQAYSGAAQDVIEAERFADAFGYGFSQGSKQGREFIDNVRRELSG